ncbi:hypothetical protein [Streptomyces spongiae]|uniref:Secreted protein n=1 Tax=Streptomyces spongiae TaxID=565072 RepID=A0A5N8XFW2_9ACTN|nr:hypothetical protein [Streptomyces spongiae]MPY58329.1 hypothetical protein [Streptomyces spongiae]
MRRGLVHVLAWLLTTGAAVTLSWWGVHSVMAGTAYDPPRALPITAEGAPDRDAKAPAPASTSPEPSTSGDGKRRTNRPDTPSPTSPSPTPSSPPSPSKKPDPSPSPTASGQVRSYDTEGGRVVFSLNRTYATLVSATPDSDWSMQVFKTEAWIRVEFASGADRVTVFCTWHDSAPRVDIQNY